MKKLMLLALIASANLYAAAEVKLNASHIKGSGTFEGSVTTHESKNKIVITKADIEKKQYPDLVSIFKDSPSTIITYTQAGPVIALRGSGEKTIQRVKVLLDGKNITTIDDEFGIIPFNAIPVSSVEKIEIVPGGGITLYGSGSSSGVINIITNAGLKDYGQVSVGTSSFDTYEVSANKGIKLGEKVFLNLAAEGKKGHGYREKEKAKKLNLSVGINYKINNKNKVRIQASKFLEDAYATSEISLRHLKEDRRAPGVFLFNKKADREALSLDYEYKPTKNLTLNTSASKSKVTRRGKNNGTPDITIIPIDSPPGLLSVGFPGHDMHLDKAMFKVPISLKGKHEEKINILKFGGDYKYNKGNLNFGIEKVGHSLTRDIKQKTAPVDPFEHMGLISHPTNIKIYTEADLIDLPILALSMLKFAELTQEYSLKIKPEKNLIAGKNKLELAEIAFQRVDKDDPIRKEYEALIKEAKDNNEEVDEEEVRYLTHKIWARVVEPLIEEGNQLPVKDYFILDKNGNIDLWGMSIVKVKDPNMTVEEFYKDYFKKPNLFGNQIWDDTTRVQTFINSKTDVKKDTQSFYLYNDYNLTNKLKMNLGLRYENSKYKGIRETEIINRISTKSLKRLTAEEIASNWNYNEKKPGDLVLPSGTTQILSELIQGSHINSVEKYFTDSKFTGMEDTLGYKKMIKDLAENEKDGVNSLEILAAKVSADFEKREENIGGEIGFDYSINDTDTAYVKYEKAFNTPLPTQLTNKTFDTLYNAKIYWDSNLRTEKIHNFELGYRGMLNDNVTFSIAGFMSETEDEIVTAVKNGNSNMKREWRFLNIDKTRRLGIELQSEQRFDKLKLKESFTYIEPRIISNNYDRDINKIVNNRIEDYIENVVNRRSEHSVALFRENWEGSLSKEELDELIEVLEPLPEKIIRREIKLNTVDKDKFFTKEKLGKKAELEKKYRKLKEEWRKTNKELDKYDRKFSVLQSKVKEIYKMLGDKKDPKYREIKDIIWVPHHVGKYTDKQTETLKKYLSENDYKKLIVLNDDWGQWKKEREKVLRPEEKDYELRKKIDEEYDYLVNVDKDIKKNLSVVMDELREKYPQLKKAEEAYDRREAKIIIDTLVEKNPNNTDIVKIKDLSKDEAYKIIDKLRWKYLKEGLDHNTYIELHDAAEALELLDGDNDTMLRDFLDKTARETLEFEYTAEEERVSVGDVLLKKGERIPLVPKVKATFNADYQFTDKLNMGTILTYVGSYDIVEPGRGYSLIKSKVPGHLLTDIYGTYNWNGNLSVRIGVNNLFNHEYNQRQDSASATPAPGRTYSAGFTYRF